MSGKATTLAVIRLLAIVGLVLAATEADAGGFLVLEAERDIAHIATVDLVGFPPVEESEVRVAPRFGNWSNGLEVQVMPASRAQVTDIARQTSTIELTKSIEMSGTGIAGVGADMLDLGYAAFSTGAASSTFSVLFRLDEPAHITLVIDLEATLVHQVENVPDGSESLFDVDFTFRMVGGGSLLSDSRL